MKPGMVPQALELYRTAMTNVMSKEPGCVEYRPTTDYDLGLGNQEKDPDMIVVLARWKTIDDFKAHVAGPQHVSDFRAAIKDLAEKITLKVTQDAI
jgi:quinol monooxygenase YgiN